MSTDSATLHAGSKVEVPLWLAMDLAERDVVQIGSPSYLNEKYRNLLKAGAEVVNFRTQSPNILENTLKMCQKLEAREAEAILDSFLNAFLERFKKLTLEIADSLEVQKND